MGRLNASETCNIFYFVVFNFIRDSHEYRIYSVILLQQTIFDITQGRESFNRCELMNKKYSSVVYLFTSFTREAALCVEVNICFTKVRRSKDT